MQLIISDHEILKFDDQTGRTWVLKEDDDECPVWVEIKDQEIKEK